MRLGLKLGLSLGALLVVRGLAAILWVIGPMLVDAVGSARQQKALQSRHDYPVLALAAAQLAEAQRTDELIDPTNPRVPPELRALEPRYIDASSNAVRLEFHGGFDHFGLYLQQDESVPRGWILYYYTEAGRRELTRITNR